jgi:predicted DNA-binding transcriptional regulator YafY
VAVHHGHWYPLCWSRTSDARRVLRVDRVAEVAVLAGTFTPPPGLDPPEPLEEHLAQGWKHEVEAVVDAPAGLVAEWLPRSLGRSEPLADARAATPRREPFL